MVRKADLSEEETCQQILEGFAEVINKHNGNTHHVSAVCIGALGVSAYLAYELTLDQRKELTQLYAEAIEKATINFLERQLNG